MTLILFGINILVLLAVWHLMVKKTILDHSRDKLFDLRDDVRREFLTQGWGLETPLYRNLRSTLDTYLRHTEGFSVWTFVFKEAELRKNPALLSHLRTQLESKFNTKDKAQTEYARTIRNLAAMAMLEFSVYSSGLLLLLTIAYTPVHMLQLLTAKIKRGFGATLEALAGSSWHLQRTFGALWRTSVRRVGNRILAPDGFEAAFSSRAWGHGHIVFA